MSRLKLCLHSSKCFLTVDMDGSSVGSYRHWQPVRRRMERSQPTGQAEMRGWMSRHGSSVMPLGEDWVRMDQSTRPTVSYGTGTEVTQRNYRVNHADAEDTEKNFERFSPGIPRICGYELDFFL